MRNTEKTSTGPTIRQQWIIACITSVITVGLVTYTPTSCNGSKTEAETEQRETQPAQKSTYEQWLVENDLALSPEEMKILYTVFANYATSDAPHPTRCMMRTSDHVSYQTGFVEPQIFDGVSEKLYGKDGEGMILEQRFPKRQDLGTTQRNGTILYAGIETRFSDFSTPLNSTLSAGDGVADEYATFIYDALGEKPLDPIIPGKTSRTVSINKEMREAYASKQDPLNAGLGSFEKYRQAAYTEALRRFLNDPENNRTCL